MAKSNQEKQDQRSNSSTEDSTAMTIEFLRARLLSERSVSRSARQRAGELEKRVEELEEELRIVSLQRKMAEKATVDVLSILESRGVSDASETFDSGSDQEAHQDSRGANGYPNDEEHSIVTNRRSNIEEFSGSDIDSSPINGRSLSWKGRSNSSRSREKYEDSSMRRRNALSSSFGSSSPKHHQGKSCRQIRRRETRPVVEEHKTKPTTFDSQENGAPTPSEGDADCLDSTPEIVREVSEIQKVVSEDPPLEIVENDRGIPNHLDVNGHGEEKDMKKALERQAQLIGQYEEMEKAQREWEEKYRENNTSTPDSYDPGNHSDVTEDRDDVKAQTIYNVRREISEALEAKSNEVAEPKESSKPQANGFLLPSHLDVGDLKDQTSSSADPVTSGFPAQEFAFPMAKEKEAQESLGNREFRPLESLHSDPLLKGTLPNQFSDGSALSDTGSSSHSRDFSRSQNNRYALVPHDKPVALGGVLDALKEAKLSLQQKINRLPLEGTTLTATTASQPIESPQPRTRVKDRMEIPVGCSGLFRLPTDFALEEASTRANFTGAGSRISFGPYHPDNGVTLIACDPFVTTPDRFVTTPDRFVSTPYYPDNGVALNARDQFVTTPDRSLTTPYLESRSGFPPDDRFHTSSSGVSASRASTLNSHFSSHLDTGLSSVNRYNNYPPHPSYPPFPDLMPRIPSDEGSRRPLPSRSSFGTPADRFSFYNDPGRPNMYT